MKFCTACGHMLTIDGAIVRLIYTCANCGRKYGGQPEDTLLLDEELSSGDSNVQNAVLIENSPFDAAARREAVPCPKCKRPYMALIILDEGLRVYKCKCGHAQ